MVGIFDDEDGEWKDVAGVSGCFSTDDAGADGGLADPDVAEAPDAAARAVRC